MNSSRELFRRSISSSSACFSVRATDDLAGLGVGFVADALSVLVGIVDDALGGLLAAISAAEIWRSLSGEVGCGSGHRSGGNGERQRPEPGQAGVSASCCSVAVRTLKIDNLGKHSVNLGGQRLQKDVDLGGIIAALGL